MDAFPISSEKPWWCDPDMSVYQFLARGMFECPPDNSRGLFIYKRSRCLETSLPFFVLPSLASSPSVTSRNAGVEIGNKVTMKVCPASALAFDDVISSPRLLLRS